MSKTYTRYDWASDRLALAISTESEELMIDRIDRRLQKVNKRHKNDRKNHRRYA